MDNMIHYPMPKGCYSATQRVDFMDCLDEGMSIVAAATECEIPKATGHRWARQYREAGDLSHRGIRVISTRRDHDEDEPGPWDEFERLHMANGEREAREVEQRDKMKRYHEIAAYIDRKQEVMLAKGKEELEEGVEMDESTLVESEADDVLPPREGYWTGKEMAAYLKQREEERKKRKGEGEGVENDKSTSAKDEIEEPWGKKARSKEPQAKARSGKAGTQARSDKAGARGRIEKPRAKAPSDKTQVKAPSEKPTVRRSARLQAQTPSSWAWALIFGSGVSLFCLCLSISTSSASRFVFTPILYSYTLEFPSLSHSLNSSLPSFVALRIMPVRSF
ncbi:hypothetical protein EJ06DRAFT_21034 [Trichodelitschia bisporula]|uniref:Helix-turn-helix domain-containing protein n=1 Tax=Trichodelitschia bisporula TaxID=703511 RepID=A0A6G1IAI1_9PEZI|nr:hypothetical protein EJ06DRAFT_21034 [Trichodelitschia bisporula]